MVSESRRPQPPAGGSLLGDHPEGAGHREVPRPQGGGGGQWRRNRIQSDWEPESDRGRQIAVKLMARAVVVVGVVSIALGLSGCGPVPPSTGVLTGRAWGCMSVIPPTVQVYASIYAGEDNAALQRVESLGVDSGEHLVASQKVARSGDTYRFVLHSGRYVLYNWSTDVARLVTVAGGGTTRAILPRACI